jgi:glycosyltransferase involved in cell wall biosynthesis
VGRTPQRVPELLYCGNIGKKQGLLEFCQIIGDSDSEFHFRIHGNGSEAGAVERWIKDRADRRFRYGGLLSEAQFVQAVAAADWFVIPERSGAGSSFLPSKLIPSISVGTPLIAVCDRTGPLGREAEEHGLGLVMEWNDLPQLLPRLREFAGNDERFAELQERCLRRAGRYRRDHAIDRVEELLLVCRRASIASAVKPCEAPRPT